MTKRTPYRSPRSPARFLVLAGKAPAQNDSVVFVCEGLAKPARVGSRYAYWRLVSTVKRGGELTKVFGAERDTRERLNRAQIHYANHRESPEAGARLMAARYHHADASAELDALLGAAVDPVLGIALIPGDCAEVEWAARA